MTSFQQFYDDNDDVVVAEKFAKDSSIKDRFEQEQDAE